MTARRRTNRKAPVVKLDSATLAAIEAAAERAAKRNANRVVKQILLAMGLNASTPEDQIELQADAAFTRRLRVAIESRSQKVGYAVFAGLISLAVALIAATVNHYWNRGN